MYVLLPWLLLLLITLLYVTLMAVKKEMIMLWTLIILPCISNVYSGEIITLEDKTHVLCAANDQESVIYIQPPITEKTEKTENSQILIEDNIWMNDWSLKKSTDTLQGPVLDKRWEDFENVYTNYKRFTSVKSVSFSIYSPDQIEFYINDEESLDYFSISPKSEHWTHYTVLLNKDNVYIFENHQLVRTINNFVPSQIVVKTKTMTFWKMHNYDLRWADRISKSSIISIPVPSIDSTCLTLSVSLCLHCSLNASVAGNTYSFEGENDTSPYMMQSWKTKRIEVEAGNNITFLRYTRNGDTTGDWKVDIRKCPRIIKSDRVIDEVKGEDAKNEMNSECRTLSYKNQQDLNRHKRSTNESETLSCVAGKLGNKCDVLCEDLLGSEKKYCQEHRICVNSDCFCAWGFKGPLCDQECDDGKWGPNCTNYCTNCEICDKRDGICPDNKNNNYYTSEKPSLSWHYAWFVLLIIPIVLVGALTLRKKNGQSSKAKDNSDSEANKTLPDYERTTVPFLATGETASK